MSIRLAASRTTTDVLTAVSSTVSVVTHGANSLAALTETAELHANAYREGQKRAITRDAISKRLVSDQEAAINIATRMMTIDVRLKEDPTLENYYNEIVSKFTDAEIVKSPALSVAAE